MLDAQYVYYYVKGGVKRALKSTGAETEVASNVDVTDPENGDVGRMMLAVDADGVTFVSMEQNSVMHCPLTGCSGDPLVVAANQGRPFGVATDDRAIYWTTMNGGTVMKVAK